MLGISVVMACPTPNHHKHFRGFYNELLQDRNFLYKQMRGFEPQTNLIRMELMTDQFVSVTCTLWNEPNGSLRISVDTYNKQQQQQHVNKEEVFGPFHGRSVFECTRGTSSRWKARTSISTYRQRLIHVI